MEFSTGPVDAWRGRGRVFFGVDETGAVGAVGVRRTRTKGRL
ncbi:hypothetical protein [Isoptericola cucumis]|nr:hypothetical protein [Isoptericola cucumis]